jgi:hypothetical protein
MAYNHQRNRTPGCASGDCRFEDMELAQRNGLSQRCEIALWRGDKAARDALLHRHGKIYRAYPGDLDAAAHVVLWAC